MNQVESDSIWVTFGSRSRSANGDPPRNFRLKQRIRQLEAGRSSQGIIQAVAGWSGGGATPDAKTPARHAKSGFRLDLLRSICTTISGDCHKRVCLTVDFKSPQFPMARFVMVTFSPCQISRAVLTGSRASAAWKLEMQRRVALEGCHFSLGNDFGEGRPTVYVF